MRERFTITGNYKGCYHLCDIRDNGKRIGSVQKPELSGTPYILDLLNEMDKENRELKSHINDTQIAVEIATEELMKRVIDCIDTKIAFYTDMKIKLMNEDDDYRLRLLSFAIQSLRELKEEVIM